MYWSNIAERSQLKCSLRGCVCAISCSARPDSRLLDALPLRICWPVVSSDVTSADEYIPPLSLGDATQTHWNTYIQAYKPTSDIEELENASIFSIKYMLALYISNSLFFSQAIYARRVKLIMSVVLIHAHITLYCETTRVGWDGLDMLNEKMIWLGQTLHNVGSWRN